MSDIPDDGKDLQPQAQSLVYNVDTCIDTFELWFSNVLNHLDPEDRAKLCSAIAMSMSVTLGE